ncbi:MAG: glycosyltransferase [Firmicutes bacterium]|nr:glycosyltransferase [Bacillota bacterium]
MLISFVIPCYRSAKTLGNVVEEIQNMMREHSEYDSEIILVNDCSPDNTFEVIESLTKKYGNITGIDIAKNSGQQCALMAGFRQAEGDLIIACDDDGQTPVDTSFRLIEKLFEGDYDVVCAKYENRGSRSLFRRLGTWADRTMVKVFLEKPDDFNTAIYFVAKRFVIEEITKYENPFPYWTGLLLRTTHNVGNVLVDQKDRAAGESGYTMRKLLSLWINGLTTFSIKPLRFATIAGSVLALIGFIIIVFLVIGKLVNADISVGWTSLIATNILVGGLIMLMLGMIGEYIGRIYISLNESPQYVIRRIIEKSDGKKED